MTRADSGEHRPGPVPSAEARELCARLTGPVIGLGGPVYWEPSFKLTAGRVLSERFLLSLPPPPLGTPVTALLRFLDDLRLPADFQAVIEPNLPDASHLHLGVEHGPRGRLYKFYLEFPLAPAGGQVTSACPPLVHLACKWDSARPGHRSLARYLDRAGADAATLVRWVDTLCGAEAPVLTAAAAALLARVARFQPIDEMLVLEVREEGNPRCSFDLCVYDAGVRLADCGDWLESLWDHFAISAQDRTALWSRIGQAQLGHFAGGVGRDGEEFCSLYYGAGLLVSASGAWPDQHSHRQRHARRPARGLGAKEPGVTVTAPAAPPALEWSQPGDRYTDFCLWDYPPATPTEGKLRSVNLLYDSFAAAGVGAPMGDLCAAIRAAAGPFNTVWGIKIEHGRLFWELYFYDYRRRQRELSISRILTALRPFARCDLGDPSDRPYFMFSLDLDPELALGRRAIEALNIYIGNVGSNVSSGICYEMTAQGLSLTNFYFFFDAQRERDDILAKVAESAYLAPDGDPALVLWPELLDCTTLVVANKRHNDGVYFTRLGVDQLLLFMRRLGYPPAMIAFVETHRERLDHLRFDVAFDYRLERGELRILKGSYYGYF
jgi:hypothetical protein